ncbi:hypothetical protein ACFE04_015544 [Oxalis oulophora]
MSAELVNAATSEKLAEVDWTKNIEISELVARDQSQAKDVVKAIKKRLKSKHPSTQLYAVLLLEILMNNIGDPIHKQVIDTGILPILVKIVKKKTDLPVRERIFLLLDATQTALGGASGKLPQYYSAYYDLVSAGVKFPQRPQATPSNNPSSQPKVNNTLKEELTSSRLEMVAEQAKPKAESGSSIIPKAANALEVLREVLDAVDMQNSEAAKDEFTLDLVEQCSFHKQQVMHLVMASRDEKLVSQAIELNDQLQKVLERHDALLSRSNTMSIGSIATAMHHNREVNHREDNNHEVNLRTDNNHGEVNHRKNYNHEEAKEEEEAEQLLRRKGKGKACFVPDEYALPEERPSLGLFGASVPPERLNRPLIRPLSSDSSHEPMPHPSSVIIPPPPAKQVERERFFQEKKPDGPTLSGHMRGLSLHSRNGSSSFSGSIDFSD